jgi:hypothetical protein
MHKLNRDGAFTDGGGASFDGVIPDVSGDKDTRDTGFEQIGVTLEFP